MSHARMQTSVYQLFWLKTIAWFDLVNSISSTIQPIILYHNVNHVGDYTFFWSRLQTWRPNLDISKEKEYWRLRYVTFLSVYWIYVLLINICRFTELCFSYFTQPIKSRWSHWFGSHEEEVPLFLFCFVPITCLRVMPYNLTYVFLLQKRHCILCPHVHLGNGLHRRGCRRIASRCRVCEVHVYYLQIQPKGFDEGESLWHLTRTLLPQPRSFEVIYDDQQQDKNAAHLKPASFPMPLISTPPSTSPSFFQFCPFLVKNNSFSKSTTTDCTNWVC